MTRDELYQTWTKKDNLTLIHKTLPDTQVKLVSAETGRSGKHYIVRLRGAWVIQPGAKYIRPFWNLAAALAAVK